jgi:hypothetical protein
MKDFTDFWGQLVVNPREFFQRDFNKSNSPYFLFVVLVYGFADQLDRMDNQMMKIANGRLSDMSWLSESWSGYLAITLVFGLLAGLMYHYLGGWWFNARIGFCGGVKDISSSRFIFLYSLFPVGFAKVLFFLPVPLKHDTPMHAYLSDDLFEGITGLIVIALLYYSLRISYIGATTVFELKDGPAKLWFLWLPSLFYTLAFAVVIGLFALTDVI